MKFFDQERSKRLFYATCFELARLNLDYNDGNEYKRIILNMKELRIKLNLSPCLLDQDEDFSNYVIAIENGNLNAVKLFTELGCNPFSESNVFHDRLFKKEQSIISLLEKLKKKILTLDPNSKEHNRFKVMIEWLDQQFADSLVNTSCIKLTSSL